MTGAAITLNAVSKAFGERRALCDISFSVRAGQSVVIMGPSGCGKTTLLRVIAGLDEPDTGDIRLGGTAVTIAGRSVLPPYRRQLGFVFQDLALWPHLTVEQQLGFVLESSPHSGMNRVGQISKTLQLVRGSHLSRRYPHELSGGEQQRVALARAVVHEPPVLLMDEPFSSLDSELRAAMRSEFRRLRGELGLTTLYVTHDRVDAEALGTRVIQMEEGRISSDHEAE
jgi:iron(III) transport system ATP-binding protein